MNIITFFSRVHEADEYIVDTWTLRQHEGLLKRATNVTEKDERVRRLMLCAVGYSGRFLSLCLCCVFTCTCTSWKRALRIETAEPGGSTVHFACKMDVIVFITLPPPSNHTYLYHLFSANRFALVSGVCVCACVRVYQSCESMESMWRDGVVIL